MPGWNDGYDVLDVFDLPDFVSQSYDAKLFQSFRELCAEVHQHDDDA